MKAERHENKKLKKKFTKICIVILAVVLILFFFGIRRMANAVYADSIKYGYYDIKDKQFWKQNNFIREVL